MILELCAKTFSSFPQILKLNSNWHDDSDLNWHDLEYFTSVFNYHFSGNGYITNFRNRNYDCFWSFRLTKQRRGKKKDWEEN